MKIFVAIDDFHRLDGECAGETASLLSSIIEENDWGKSAIPSRHRLYPNLDIAYKKHNTARSFSADIKEQYLEDFIDYACKIIQSQETSDSNSGLVIAIPEQMENKNEIIEYAYRVKEEMVSKDEALAIAERPGLYVFELNGKGNGLIGALAGAGLRITGNDGQFKGKLQLGTGEGYIATVMEIIDKSHVEQVKNMDFENIGNDAYVRMGETIKIVLLDNKHTLMVFPTGIEYPTWQTSTTYMLRTF